MPQRTIQPSFAGGEVSPNVYARIDLAKYSVSARKLLNYMVHAHGGASNRAGLEFVTETKESGEGRSRIIEFEAANNDVYILEFGNLYMRVTRNGSVVVHSDGPDEGEVYEIETPYLEADLPLLKYEQSNDVMTITHASYETMELSRFDHDEWTLTEVDFQPDIAAPTGQSAAATVVFSGAGYIATDHIYKISAISAETGEESLPSAETIAVSNDVAINRANFNIVTWSAVAGASEYIVYKKKNGIFGFMGRTIDLAFRDDNIGPDYTNTPQKGTNPFDGPDKYPRTVSFHDQRRVFGGSNTRPQNVWMTQTSNYKNMGVSAPAKDNEAVTFGIAARSKQTILHIVSLEAMLVFTPSTEWKVTGPDQGVITPSSILLKPQSYFGSSEVRPIVIGDQVLFVQSNGRIVRDIGFQFDQNKYVSNELTILSSHLFEKSAVAGWCYAQSPNSQVQAFFEDGSWASLTYMKEHQVWAWSPQKTRGYIESTASVPEFGEDYSYFIVRRYINGAWRRFIERQRSRILLDVKDAFFVDCGLSIDTAIVMETMTLAEEAVFGYTSHGLTDGQEVEATTNESPEGHKIDGRFIVDRIDADTFKLRKEATDEYVNTSDWGVFDLVCHVRILIDQVAGLNHLVGEAVVGLADGNVIGMEGDIIVNEEGEVTLPFPAGRICLGLGYVSDLETLDLAAGQQVVQGMLKNVGPVELMVKDTRGIEVGPDFDSLREHKPREFEDYDQPAELITGYVEVTPEPDWNRGGRICVRQRYPLPCTILATVPNVEFAA